MSGLTFSTLLAFDWRQLRRGRSFWLLTGLLLAIGGYAALYGRGEVREQHQKIALLRHDIDSSMAVVQARLRKDDTTAAWHYDDFLFALHSNPPDGLAALAFGQRDLHKFAVSITIGSYFYNRYAGGYENKTLSGELANPQQQFAGHLDVSFVLVFLLPLYFILLSYNVLSSEQEGGTLPLLAVQQVSPRMLLYTKLGLRALLTIALGGLIILLGASLTGALAEGRLLYFLGGTALYVACWAGIIALVTAFAKSSSFNALALLSGWLLVCLVLPAGFTAGLNVMHPTGTQAALLASVQQANARVFNTPHPALAREFYQAYPRFNNVPRDTFPGMWYNPRWLRAVHRLLDRQVQPAENRYQRQLSQRLAAADRLDYFSPALLLQSILHRAAASDLGQLAAYDRSTYAHFARWRDYLDERTYLRHNILTQRDFDQLPREDFRPVIDYPALRARLLALAGLAVILLGLSAVVLQRRLRYLRA